MKSDNGDSFPLEDKSQCQMLRSVRIPHFEHDMSDLMRRAQQGFRYVRLQITTITSHIYLNGGMYVQSLELMCIGLSINCGNGYRCYLQPLYFVSLPTKTTHRRKGTKYQYLYFTLYIRSQQRKHIMLIDMVLSSITLSTHVIPEFTAFWMGADLHLCHIMNALPPHHQPLHPIRLT